LMDFTRAVAKTPEAAAHGCSFSWMEMLSKTDLGFYHFISAPNMLKGVNPLVA